MHIVFFATPEYVLPILDSLNKNFRTHSEKSPISAVVTQKPKPQGRKKLLSYSSVDTWAHQRKIPIFFDPEELIKNKIEADIGILAAFGQIIPVNIINHFPFGILNIHPSLLPKWRGASPVQAAILAGEKETGVSIIKLDELLDHGDIVSQFKEEILANDTAGNLRTRLFERSVDVLTALIPAYTKGKITPRKQIEKNATFTRQITKNNAFIPTDILNSTLKGATFKGGWKMDFVTGFTIKNPDSKDVDRFIRAMQPWPIAWTLLRLSSSGQAKRLKILKAHLEENKLVLDGVQLEGKKSVTWKQFKDAYNPQF